MLLFLDGQGHYDTSGLAAKYSAVDSTTATWSVVPEGRIANAIKRVSTSNETGLAAPVGHLTVAPLRTRTGSWTVTKSGVCGFAAKVADLSRLALTYAADGSYTSKRPYDFFSVMEGAACHVKVALLPDGTFQLRGNGKAAGGYEVPLAVTGEAIQSNAWAYVEFKWYIHPTAGTFEIHVNGVQILNFTGDTDYQGNTWNPTSLGVWSAVQLFGMASLGSPWLTAWLSDVYLADLTAPSAADVHDFLGDGVVTTIFPNGPGSSSDWTPTPTGANWDQVNDAPTADGDTTYVSTPTTNAKDVYQFTDIPTGSTVLGAQLVLLPRKDTEGSAQVAPIAHQGSTDYLSPAQGVASTAYDRYLTAPLDSNPATGAAWTAAEINAGQFGVVKSF
jgi:hypothetical protein